MFNVLFWKQENLITAYKKIVANREDRIINPAIIIKTPYITARINLNNMLDLIKMKGLRGGEIKGFKLITRIIKNNKKILTLKTKTLKKYV